MPVLRNLKVPHIALGVVAATFCGAWSLAAQDRPDSRQGPVWALEGLQAGQCVRFLMDPAASAKELRPGARPLRADQDSTLHPALQSVVATQPEFASWTPASLCLFYADAIHLGGRRFGSKDPRRKQLLGLWAVAATEPGGARRDMVLDLFGGRGDLVRAADMGKVKMREVRSTVANAAGTGNDLYDVRIGKTRLIWNGRPAGDSTRVDHPIEQFSLTRGASGTFWKLHAAIRPLWTRPLVGFLSVEGKDDLAKALKGSPTRFVGPVYYGGGGELRFTR
jgi:hypothetical protein